ncbi:Outer membrane lipoprotein LolB [Desulfacinum hydrothermale DSM 13146]|uniref:Outer membrane lipoprotein LolB n=1 Tax=Desulfacinum hydrothermale DSM 13146 TaxID=1121390 RepID=A0A1W1X8T4_9BACT|nr:lipoprotein insertase outer membrane protein LolB [Desulfacinum hydrothermale]SMC20088.1 Outer membrane lipoprotein LolB [Desulfacinum hydrothermale DSM 13146]
MKIASERPRKRHHVFACLLAVMVLGAACAPRPTLGPVRGPSQFSTWKAQIQDRLAAFQAFQAVYKVRLVEPQGRTWHAKAVVTVHLPDQARLEVLGPMNRTQGVLLASRTMTSLWILSDGTVYTADDSALLLGRLVGVEVPVDLLASLLIGCPPEGDLKASGATARSDGAWIHTVKDPGKAFQRTYHIRKESGLLERVILSSPDGKNAVATLHHDPHAPYPLVPDALSFTAPRSDVRLTRRAFKPLDSVDPALFGLPPAAQTAKRVHLHR